MRVCRLISLVVVGLCVIAGPRPAFAQVVESVGSRALGMGGAFVAVASDSSAVWWNPAGLAAGPFFDMALEKGRAQAAETLPAWRRRFSGFSAAVPPLGLSYYRFRITDIQPFDPTTEQVPGGREDRRAGVPVRSLAASQLGVTVVQTLLPGVHAGATLKYVRGALHSAREDGLEAPGVLLDRGEELETGSRSGDFGIDLGVLAVAGVVRIGARMGNVRESDIGGIRMQRQTRVGMAIDPGPVTGLPLTVAFDADVTEYESVTGMRRILALGAEQWLFARRLGLRGGGRANTTGAQERVGTAGASVSLRPGMFVDAHVSRGSAHEAGWSVTARVSF
jgi:long-chain fatty acid transport protein